MGLYVVVEIHDSVNVQRVYGPFVSAEEAKDYADGLTTIAFIRYAIVPFAQVSNV